MSQLTPWFVAAVLLVADMSACGDGPGGLCPPMMAERNDRLQKMPRVKLAADMPDGRPSVRWRGFNLTEMVYRSGSEKPKDFREEDFRLIREWGFNFVRLPLDYRYWIKDGEHRNWEVFDADGLKPVDRAVALGRKYGIHVCICMHRCPGHAVSRPKEPTSMFSDGETLRVCASHWAMLARRYKGIPNEELSFNLFNEPPDIDEGTYEHVVKTLVAAIRSEDPVRFAIADGPSWGHNPTMAVCSMKGVGLAGRGYLPKSVTHYQAPWIAERNSPPVWPIRSDMPEGMMAGPLRSSVRRPFELIDLPPGTMSFRFGKTSGPVTVKFTADGAVIREVRLNPEQDNPLWEAVTDHSQWGVRQGHYLGREKFEFPASVRRFAVEVVKGDWVQFGGLVFTAPDGAHSVALESNPKWGTPRNFTQRFSGWNEGFKTTDRQEQEPAYRDAGKEYLYRIMLAKWDKVIAQGVFCFVGEFGVWKKTPHATAMDIMEDYLYLWKERNMGWALWNLRGANGVLDSEREDVEYEDFRGHKLDRRMLELLQRY